MSLSRVVAEMGTYYHIFTKMKEVTWHGRGNPSCTGQYWLSLIYSPKLKTFTN